MTAEITPETLRLAGEGAHCLDAEAHTKNYQETVQAYKARAAAIRSLVAHATEMQAVMKAKDRPDKPGRWFHYDCIEGKDGWLNYSENDIAACHVNPPTCGKFIGPFALTETPRPEPTGEGMGEG